MGFSELSVGRGVPLEIRRGECFVRRDEIRPPQTHPGGRYDLGMSKNPEKPRRVRAKSIEDSLDVRAGFGQRGLSRRQFLELSMLASTGTLLAGCGPAPSGTGYGKRILVLGGTNFLGPAIVERATECGHQVTLFNRGITRPHLFPELEKLRGERRIEGGDLAALSGPRRWDVVIDVWPERSELVRQTVELLSERTDYYFFCSSVAVYRDFSQSGLNESAPTWIDEPGWYGGEKAVAEAVVAERFPGRSGVVRCHAILGPRDNGAAYHYWLRRLATYDEVLAPGTGVDPVQYVDVLDVAAWIVDCCEQSRDGVYNLCGPNQTLTLRAFLDGSREAIGSSAKLAWVDADFLRSEHGVHSFTDLPLWAPLDEDAGFYQVDGSKAVAAGAAFRPLSETARSAWRWYQSYFFKDASFPRDGMGLSRERETELLEAWRSAG